MKVRRRAASWMRKWADRLDFAGAPKCTQWSFTIEDGWGAMVNDKGKGCPLWFYGDDEYERAHRDRTVHVRPDDTQWVTLGSPTPDGGVHVLGSAEVTEVVTTRRTVGHDLVAVPGAVRTARVPRQEITLTCKLTSFVSLPGVTYRDALLHMFRRGGVRG